MADTAARLIALDWGTSNLRASLLGSGARVLATRSAAAGVMAVPGATGAPAATDEGAGRFEAPLMALVGDWIDRHRCPLVASGMIGSRQGWREAPYVQCPAGLSQVAAHLVPVPMASGGTLHIVPGLACIGADGQDDVMRGEETQLFGAALPPRSCCVLPGTHSKWAWLGEGGEVRSFQTFMTGELYAVLARHSILGRLMDFGGNEEAAIPAPPAAAAAGAPGGAAAFAEGVQLGLAEYASATHVLFAARTAGLTRRIGAAALPDFLSGLLIGIEIGSATRASRPAGVALLGEPALCARYALALDLARISHQRVAADATTRGQWRVAAAAGLVAEGVGEGLDEGVGQQLGQELGQEIGQEGASS
ncbi:MAG: 2-dehydro-3-deoxygalactonokinase [Rubrivivax sp.]|nr:2-dehydro-3-deoxygalactonokinase [Rubrivivax sp.]